MRIVAVILGLLISTHLGHSQSMSAPRSVAESTARQHLIQHSEPVYPAIAKAAHVQGDVVVGIVITNVGRIASAKVLSGPPMLRQAALNAIKTWRFAPFQIGGVASQVSTTLTIPFHMAENPAITPAQEQAAQAWFSLSDKCRKALSSRSADSVDRCKEALEMALKAGDLTESSQLGLLDSHEEYGEALLLTGKLKEALAEENSAIAVAKIRLKDTDVEYAWPFYWRGAVEANLGDDEAASADLSVAEETIRKAITHLPEMKEMYGRNLATVLKQHAELLDRMSRTADAAKLRAEAASL